MTDRADRLRAFLARFDSHPAVWGKTDCSAASALWVGEERGIEVPLPKWSSREEAHALIAKAGGLVALWDTALSGLLFERHDQQPDIGDVGIIDTRLHGPMGVICGSPGVAIRRRDEGGWRAFAPREYIKVWALD